MKKIVLIFSLVVTVLGIFLVALPTILKVSGLAQPIKNYLLSSLLEGKSYSINLDDFKIGLGTIEFNNVALKSNTNHYRLGINSIRLGYKLTGLILRPDKPLRALKSITLIKPYLFIRQDSITKRPDSVSKWRAIQSIIQKLNQKKSLKLFSIEDGEIVYETRAGEKIVLGKRLNGALRSDDLTDIEIGLGGELLSDRSDQVELSGRMNIAQKKLRLLCRFNRYELKNSYLQNFISEIRFPEGELSGWVLMENRGWTPDSTNFNGELTFSDFAIEHKDQTLRDINFKAVVSNNRLTIDTLRARFASSDIQGNIWVDDILKPHIFTELDLRHFALKYLLPSKQSEWYTNALINGRVSANIDPQKVQGKLILKNGAISFTNDKTLRDVRLSLLFNPDTIALQRLSARMDTVNRFDISGIYLKKADVLNIITHAEHHTARHVIFDQLSKKAHLLDIRFSYRPKTGKMNGSWRYTLKGRADTLLAMSGSILGSEKLLNIDLKKSSVNGFEAGIQISDLLQGVQINRARIKNFPFFKLTTAPFLFPLLSRAHNELELSGPLNRLKVYMLLKDSENPKNRAEFLATLNHMLSGTRMLDGLIRLKNISGNTSIKFSEDYLDGVFRFGNQVKGNLKIDFSKERYLDGQLRFSRFNVVKALSDSVIPNNFHFLGTIDGKVTVNGDINNPVLTADLSGDRFVFNDIGYYQAGLQLKANKDSVRIDSLFIAVNNLPILQGRGKVQLKQKRLKCFFYGNNVDVEQLINTFPSRKIKLTGMMDYTLGLNGSLTKPHVDLSLSVADGILDRIEFDRLFIHLQNEFVNGGTLFSKTGHIININQLQLTKQNQFELTGLGQIPLYSKGHIDLYLNFKGDLFRIIPLYEPFFEKGVSQVELHLGIGGTPERLRLSSGYMLINDGELWLKNVAHHIKNITGVIEKKNDSNHVNFINLTAESGGETLTINTVRNVKLADGRTLSPWYFRSFDLDFGVLKMETTGHGVQVHIPNLMLPNYDGRLALSGMHPGESFYFAGPIKHPVLHGKVTVYDTRLTFPFIKSNTPNKNPNPVVEFLTNINWDLKVVSGKDVVYAREIPAYIDNVSTELFVDETSPGLYFKGILRNQTFRVSGKLSSSRGRLEYLDQTFRVDHFQAEFMENSPYPFISGQAWTTIRDSIGAIPKTIYLKLYALDPETKQEKHQGSLENFKFKLVSADPQIGEDQERVLSYLGFSLGNIREKATSVGGAVTDKYIFRPLFRPLERAIERSLGIDFVRINSNIAKNLFYTSIGYGRSNLGKNQPLIDPFNSPIPYLFLIQSSEVTLGKYLTQNLYLTYTGQLVSVYDQTKPKFDVNHSFGLEYRFFRNILLEIEYDRELMGYYKIPNQKQYLEDVKIRLRHSFTF